MIALLQRVSKAAVTRGDERRDSGPGLAILLGVGRDDTDADAVKLAARTATLRIFDDAEGKLNRSLLDVQGAALVVPQFTLCADTRQGRRPSYDAAAAPEPGEILYRRYVAALRDQGIAVTEGWFRATMQVEIHNDGPVSIILQSPPTGGEGRGAVDSPRRDLPLSPSPLGGEGRGAVDSPGRELPFSPSPLGGEGRGEG